MRFIGFLYAALALAVFLPVRAGAEEKTGSVVFERNDRLLTWKNTNSGEFAYRPNLRLNFNSELSTSLSMTTGSTLSDRWYDQINNSAQLDYGLSDKLDLGFSLVERWNKDTMSRAGSSFLTTDAGGKVTYRPFGGIDLQGTLGHTHDERFENRDSGVVASGKMLYSWNPGGAFRNVRAMVDMSGGTSSLRRSNDNGRIYAHVAYRNPLADMSMELTDSRTVRGYFAESAGEAGVGERKDIEERASSDRNLMVTLSRGNLSDDWNVSGIQMLMGLGDRRIDDSANEKDPKSPKYHTNSNGNLQDFALRGKRTVGRFRGEMEARYNRDENNVQRAIRSRTQTDVTTWGKLDVVLSGADSLNVVGRIKRSRIDTPAVVHNDRDELNFDGGLLYLRRWAEDFSTMLDLRVLETHYVNINVTQSSQNKWMRTYRLSPSFEYIPSAALKVRHEVGLQADYMDFDFDKGATPRSTITRRVSSETWLTGILSPAVKATAGVMFEENEYGRLNTKGSKIPAEEGIRRFLDISVRYEFTRWLIFVPQYVYAIRKDRSVERGTLERREIDQTFGMDMLLFENRARDGHDFKLGCKRIVRKTADDAPQIRNYISMTLTYGF
jgi:hypothetical protein